MELYPLNGNQIYSVYGDPAYPQSPWILGGFRYAVSGSDKANYTQMSKVREVVEWGFGNILQNVSQKQVHGGLRRLESQRKEYAAQLQQAQSNLIAGIGQYLMEARKNS